MFLVGLGFIILGVTLWPGIGILVGIFIWWIAWRFMLSSSRKSRIKEALKRIREKQATSLSSSTSKYQAPTPESDVKKETGLDH
jgi:Na+/melibiose symporter-like transporter